MKFAAPLLVTVANFASLLLGCSAAYAQLAGWYAITGTSSCLDAPGDPSFDPICYQKPCAIPWSMYPGFNTLLQPWDKDASATLSTSETGTLYFDGKGGGTLSETHVAVTSNSGVKIDVTGSFTYQIPNPGSQITMIFSLAGTNKTGPNAGRTSVIGRIVEAGIASPDGKIVTLGSPDSSIEVVHFAEFTDSQKNYHPPKSVPRVCHHSHVLVKFIDALSRW